MGISSTDQRADTCQHALALAGQRIKIVLLGDAGTERAKIPRLKAWGSKATSDEDTIIELFERYPRANIGALLGPEGGIIDVEFDTPEGREKADELFKGVVTVAYESVRSVHRLFKWSDEMPAQQKIEVDGLEIRFGGGGKQTQSVLPPSIHPTGTPYKWLPGLSPMETDIAEMPYELLVRIVNGDDLSKSGDAEFDGSERRDWNEITGGVAEGGRNAAATALAGRLYRLMVDLSDPDELRGIAQDMENWNAKNRPPLPLRELRQVMLSILNKERIRRESACSAVGLGPSKPTRGDIADRPAVVVTMDEGAVADQVIKHIGQLGWPSQDNPNPKNTVNRVYVRAGVLVEAIESDDPSALGQLSIRPLPNALTRERITQSCWLLTERKTGGRTELVPTRAAKWLVDAVHARGQYRGRIRPLTGIIAAPTLRPDGSILQTPGYDDATALLYRPSAEFPLVPESPSREDARAAIDELLEVITDFPMVSDADRIAWVCLVLTMICRACIPGCCPMFVVTANIRGAGKSLGIDSASIIAYGRPAARQTYTRDDEEMRKVITTVAIEGTPSVLFDNLDVQVGGPAIDAAITSRTVTGRILGKSQSTGELPMRTVWTATGNNVSYGSDGARRVLPIRMQSLLETPEERTDFRHPDLLAWANEHRPRLAVAALTVLRAHFVADRPEQSGGQWGSFEAWIRVIRDAVVWAGAADPLQTRDAATANDDSRALLGLLIAGLEEADPDREGLTTNEVERLTSHRPDESPTCPALVEAVRQVCGDRFNARRFGNRMRSYVGRVCDGRRIEREKGHAGFVRWVVRPAVGESAIQAVSRESETHHQTHRDTHRNSREKSTVGESGESTSNPSHIGRVFADNTPVSHPIGAAGEPDSPEPPDSPDDRYDSYCSPRCDPSNHADIDEAGSIRTTCRRCGRFIGRRPTVKASQRPAKPATSPCDGVHQLAPRQWPR